VNEFYGEGNVVIPRVSLEEIDGQNSPRRFCDIPWVIRSHRGVGEDITGIPGRYKSQEG
jgi:hypothetical protein